ncbi:MAG TPA: DNA-binding response regulator [Chromatiaceae bacterium]|jgi:DNA-binding NarL/FixJ family response regulator|nr:MAG: hypothetical protein N838_02605 [Thiohalocapsa sp. PB-PSB1]QQO52838.1 MAG: response regulator transcription factor [Thiohalocapsa sp. PB-PSB1]HBG95809.1 DNA-binding response regulator [Chromatiaceae bacterium]HCS91367.1 DNA-binding response regulator [Chromatiaceae bacterium]
MADAKKILLIDDLQLTYEGVAAVLAQAPEFKLLEHLADPSKAVQVASLHKPDLALVDICMPKVNGLEVTAKLTQAVPSCRIIALSAYDDNYLVDKMIEAGARGYVLKSQAGAELLIAIRTVLDGGSYLQAVSAGRSGGDKGPLSPREQELLRLIAAAKGTAEIATLLGISVKTVETYRRRIMHKLGVDNSIDLVRAAMVLGRGG